MELQGYPPFCDQNGPSISDEWRLALCHVPTGISISSVVEFFSPISLKHINCSVTYRRWKVVEVSFHQEADMRHALKERNYQCIGKHRVTLKLSEDTLAELNRTALYWHTLPRSLVEDSLLPLDRARIYRFYKSLVKQGSTFGDIYVEDCASTPASTSVVRIPILIDDHLTHLVLIHSTDLVSRLYTADSSGLYDFVDMNAQLNRITIIESDCLKVFHPYHVCWFSEHTEIKAVDTFVHFNVWPAEHTPDTGQWTLAIFVPFLKMNVHTPPGFADDHEQWSQRHFRTIQEVMDIVESFDLWWPYPEDQTEWLRASLAVLTDDARGNVTGYLRWRNHFSLDCPGRTAIHNRHGPLRVPFTDIMFNVMYLDKRDCAIVGQYIASLKLPGVAPPPYGWRDSYFLVGSSQNLIDHDNGQTLKNIRNAVRYS